jgi:two-component system NtrC family sensor kinase
VKYLTVLLLLLSLPVFSQKGDASLQTPFRLDSTVLQGKTLNKGWRWHTGDNPDFAKPDFNDAQWAAINPSKDIDDLPQIKQAGFGWFRLRLQIDPKLANTIVRVQINQILASEVYLDGKRIVTYGKVSLNPDLVEAYNPSGLPNSTESVYVQLSSKAEQVLAVRFALEPNLYYARVIALNPCFQIKFRKADSVGTKAVDTTPINHIEIGIFLILILLHFTFYFSFRSQIASLYFGYYCFFVAAYMLLDQLTLLHTHSVAVRINVNYLLSFTYFFSTPSLLTAIYRLFSYHNKKTYSLLISYTITGYLLTAVKLPGFEFLFWSYPVVLMLEVLRVSIVALKQKKAGAKILLLGTTGFLLFTIAFVINDYLDYKGINRGLLGTVFWHIGLFCVPISFTIFTAKEFARTGRSLQKKLEEVETLSAEKEQILTTQNETLERQVTERTGELNQSLAHLRTTQAQLIQKEKLASLGELTAGIAHEIQNPLNFVNNFSELSVELAQELKEEAEKPEIDKELIIDLARDLTQNQEKINLHGKRASSIVKGMLEHSRITTGERQLTDINQLADEYLRLAYHGLKAKVSNFECELMTDFDPNLPKVEVVPQEIGRVLLNLINNGFYVVQEQGKRKTEHGISAYKPTLTLRTKAEKGQLIIYVKDNGGGIPDTLKDKIFQPFFTTKPTGEGTGLGLSLAYDIVTKGHGGTLEVETKEGEGTTFLVKLPIEAA